MSRAQSTSIGKSASSPGRKGRRAREGNLICQSAHRGRIAAQAGQSRVVENLYPKDEFMPLISKGRCGDTDTDSWTSAEKSSKSQLS